MADPGGGGGGGGAGGARPPFQKIIKNENLFLYNVVVKNVLCQYINTI